MNNEKLTKSLSTIHTILKIMKVLTIIAIVLMGILSLALPSMGTIIVQSLEIAAKESGEALDAQMISMIEGGKDVVVGALMVAFIAGIVSAVISVMYLSKGVKLVGRMRTEAIFAQGYGDELRRIGKLIIIQFVATIAATIVLTFIFAPEMGSTMLSFNISTIIIAAFVYLASYLMDYAFENMKKDEVIAESQVVYVEPMIGDGSEM